MTPLGFRLQTPRDDAPIALVGAQRAIVIVIVVAARASVAFTLTATIIISLSTLVLCVGFPTECEFARRRAHRFDGERAIVQRLPLGDAACACGLDQIPTSG